VPVAGAMAAGSLPKGRCPVNARLQKPATTVSLRVRVDRTLCQGHARCVVLAPELFEADEFGGGREIGDGGVPSDLENKAWLAKANCPEFAIDVERLGETA
jgi:ferredoxin